MPSRSAVPKFQDHRKGCAMRNVRMLALAVGALIPQAASASLVFTTGVDLSGQGFGAHPRIITIQETGNGDNSQSGCISVGAGGVLQGGAGSCVADATVHDANGVTNSNANSDLA